MTAATDHAIDPFVHPALFYRDHDEYLAGTVSFIREGLANGEPVAVSVPTANLALLRGELGSDAAAVLLMDMTVEGRNPGRIIPGVLRAFADNHPHGRVRIIGEPIWAGRSEVEYPACAQHEALINAAFTGREVTILCPYDVTNLSPEVLADAHVTHPTIIDGAHESVSAAYDPDLVVSTYNRPLPEPPDADLVLEFDVTSLPQVRSAVLELARRYGASEDRIVDVELIVGEAIANSVVHGGGSGTVICWRGDGQLCCQIRDGGHITDPLAGRLPASLYSVGGRGLLLINHLSDLVRVYTGPAGTTLHVQVSLT
ncbi:sensor histidine kinase [Nocardia yunnanensis]|uniref:Sensor histidine kinase n=1 Tax=Nocardia yunnanensis TaxID=2382165 RepID=A0A386ZJJ6_9NOCA|nr:sensor histidine kinase [Nocardia yunnanensis]AYF77721.1 sensor histidine kinase [Nocardia yunnanensis]